MKVYFMEFAANGITVCATALYDNVQAVLDEVNHRRSDILNRIACRSEDLHYDPQWDDDAGYNEEAVWTFDSWMQKFSSILNQPGEDKSFHFRDGDINIHFRQAEVRSRFATPGVAEE